MKKRKAVPNIWLLAVISGAGCMVLTVILALPAAKMLESGMLPIKAMKGLSYILLGLSALAGAMFTACNGKQKRLLRCLVTATIFFLSIAIVNGILQKGAFQRIGETALIIYTVSAAAGLLCSVRKKRY